MPTESSSSGERFVCRNCGAHYSNAEGARLHAKSQGEQHRDFSHQRYQESTKSWAKLGDRKMAQEAPSASPQPCGAKMPYDNECKRPKGHPGEHLGSSLPGAPDDTFEKQRDVRARAQEHGQTANRVTPSTHDKDTMELRGREPRPEKSRNVLVEEMHAKQMGEEPSRTVTHRHLIFGRGLGFKKMDRFNKGSRN